MWIQNKCIKFYSLCREWNNHLKYNGEKRLHIQYSHKKICGKNPGLTLKKLTHTIFMLWYKKQNILNMTISLPPINTKI